jgi:hypothetical protein
VEPFKPCRDPRRPLRPADPQTVEVILNLGTSARLLNMPASTVARWARSGRIPVAHGDTPLAFRPSDLDAISVRRVDPDKR